MVRLRSFFIVFTAAALLLGFSTIAYASSPPPGYGYVKVHAITGSSDGYLSDYQMKFVVHSGEGIDKGEDVYLNGHSQSWPDDFRFLTEVGVYLPYWIESYDNSTATVWVEISYIPASPGTGTVELYYGKKDDPGASSGDYTFVFYDDMSDLSHWSTNGASTDGNVMDVGAGEYAMTARTFDCRHTAFRCRIIAGAGSNMEKYFGWGGDTGYNFTPDNGCGLWFDGGRDGFERLQNGSGQGPSVGFPATEWAVYDLYLDSAGDSARVFKDGVQILNGSISCNKVQKWMMSSNPQCGGIFQLDWLAVREKTNNEPAHGAWSAEEHNDIIRQLKDNLACISCCCGCLCAPALFLVAVLVVLVAYTLRKR